MGGLRESFFTTHWSLVDKVKQQGDRDKALIGLLLERYWKPVYCYLRRKGYDNEQAKDLTQGFFHEVVLDRHLVERADPAKGSFRSLLLHALHQYMIDDRRRASALKRIPKNKLVSIDIDDPPELPDSSSAFDPEESFNYAWKVDLLERALAEVKENYVAQGLATHWRVFQDRLLQPVLRDQQSPSLQEICKRHGITDEARASHMLDTVKRHFHKVLRKHVRLTVGTSQGVKEEMEEFLKFFKK
jgi:RNA polymerase sigma-70 factor (ECF subfamily)